MSFDRLQRNRIKRRLEASGVKTSTGKDNWSKRAVERILTNVKYTGDVAIAYSGDPSKKMMYGNHHTGIISKEMYEAVQMEMAARGNVEKTEEGTRRKNTKYSSKKKKTVGGRSSIKLDKNPIDVADGMLIAGMYRNVMVILCIMNNVF